MLRPLASPARRLRIGAAYRAPPPLLRQVSSSFFSWGSSKDGGGGEDDGGKGGDATADEKGENRTKAEVVVDEGASETGLVSLGGVPAYPHVVAVPVSGRPLFPGLALPIAVQPEVLEAITASQQAGQPYVGVFLRRDDTESGGVGAVAANDDEVEGEPRALPPVRDVSDLHDVGTFAQVASVMPFPDGSGGQVLVQGRRRVRIIEAFGRDADEAVDTDKRAEVSTEDSAGVGEGAGNGDGMYTDAETTSSSSVLDVLRVKVEHITGPSKDFDPQSDEMRAYSNEFIRVLREVMSLNPLMREHLATVATRVDVNDVEKLADFGASITSAAPDALQQVLAEMDMQKRLSHALLLLTKERELSKLQQDISKQVEEQMTEDQRKYMLQKQLKNIKKELGLEKDDKDTLINKFRSRLEACGEIPAEASAAMEDEFEKLDVLEKNSSEFNVTRSYLDWLTSMPWGKLSKENFDVPGAQQILDEEHYGLDEVKEAILQFIAIGRLRGSVQGKILLLVGPPGVGKTSIGASIARALNREFYRFSVGGLSDVAEVKGHRRTYIGAMPGKPVQCLKTTQTCNPLVLIDEIDKLGRGHQGDPASALLELLDPSQNTTFTDHYLDIPIDMSKALFMCTANDASTIPGPLIDRMEVVRLSGYDAPEKMEIARRYLVPKALHESGLGEDSDLAPASLTIADDAIEQLARHYCREAGVRNLQQHIEKICRKLALKVVQQYGEGQGSDDTVTEEADWAVTAANLEDYVGKPTFNSDLLYDFVPPGVVMGLAWTAMGGSSLFIETQIVRRHGEPEDGRVAGGGRVTTTGQLGDVMSESIAIAQTVARHKLANFLPESAGWFDAHDLHIHVPDGAVKKDGPSAGVTMVTALLSLAMQRSVRNDIAMSGEVSLTGKVLPVGGIKEKTIAARRAGVSCLVFPFGNKRDFDELPEYLREGLEAYFVKTYDEVFDIAFGEDNTFE